MAPERARYGVVVEDDNGSRRLMLVRRHVGDFGWAALNLRTMRIEQYPVTIGPHNGWREVEA